MTVEDEPHSRHRPRAWDLGLTLGELQPGPLNVITDVDGVRVGRCTITEGEGAVVLGQSPYVRPAPRCCPTGVKHVRQAVPVERLERLVVRFAGSEA